MKHNLQFAAAMLVITVCFVVSIVLIEDLSSKAHATDIQINSSAATVNYTYGQSGTVTNVNTVTNWVYVENDDYHTCVFNGQNTGSTTVINAGSVVLSWSLDKTNLFPFWTNSVASTNAFANNTNVIGKWTWLNIVYTYTNGTPIFEYLGGR